MKNYLNLLWVLVMVGSLAACGGGQAHELGGTLTGDPNDPVQDPTMTEGSPVIPHTNDFASFAERLGQRICAKVQECGLIETGEDQCIETFQRIDGIPASLGIEEISTLTQAVAVQMTGVLVVSSENLARCEDEINALSCEGDLLRNSPADDRQMLSETGFNLFASSAACRASIAWRDSVVCGENSCDLLPANGPPPFQPGDSEIPQTDPSLPPISNGQETVQTLN